MSEFVQNDGRTTTAATPDSMTTPTASRIAEGLSEVQKMQLTTRTRWKSPSLGAEPCWMTFPAPNTHRVLMRLGLVDSKGVIRELGLQVRNHLIGEG